MDAVMRIDVSVFVESDKAPAWAIGNAVAFNVMRFCHPISCGSGGVIRKTNVIDSAALPTGNAEGEIVPRRMEEKSKVILGVKNDLVTDTRFPGSQSLRGREVVWSGREAQNKAEQCDGQLLKQSNLFYGLIGLRQCSPMRNFALNTHFPSP